MSTVVIWLVIVVIFVAVSSAKAKAQQHNQQPSARPGPPVQITHQPSTPATGFSGSTPASQADAAMSAISNFLGLTQEAQAPSGSRTPRAHAHGARQRGPVMLGGFDQQNTLQPPAPGFGGVQTGGRPLGAPVTDANWVSSPPAQQPQQIVRRQPQPNLAAAQPVNPGSVPQGLAQAAHHPGGSRSMRPMGGLPGSSLLTGAAPADSLFTRGTVLQSSLLDPGSPR